MRVQSWNWTAAAAILLVGVHAFLRWRRAYPSGRGQRLCDAVLQ